MKKIIIIIAVIFSGMIANASELSTDKNMLEAQLYAQLSDQQNSLNSEIELVQIPVLSTKLSANDVITEDDITYIEIDSRRAERGYILAAEDLIGKSPVRAMFANRPIMPNQIKEQTLVHEKKSVTIFLKNKLIQMQDVGVALEDGTKGDFVRVRNATSNIVISGKVVGENLVEVAPQAAILASR